jgi:hypothetical protein
MARRGKRETGGQGIGERFTPLVESVLKSSAWRDLNSNERALYVELRGIVHHTRPWENNGEIFLSVRDAAENLGVGRDGAQSAFWGLQRHGFIVVTQIGHLGANGHGKASTYRLTCCGCKKHPRGTREFERWSPGCDFPVVKAPARRGRSKVEEAARA